VKNTLDSGLGKSVREIGLKTDINRGSVLNILNKELKLFPYKVQLMQKLSESSLKKD
jgi:hypothetical protein